MTYFFKLLSPRRFDYLTFDLELDLLERERERERELSDLEREREVDLRRDLDLERERDRDLLSRLSLFSSVLSIRLINNNKETKVFCGWKGKEFAIFQQQSRPTASPKFTVTKQTQNYNGTIRDGAAKLIKAQT